MSAKDELQRLCAEGGSHARIKYLRNKIKRATIAELRKLLRERGVMFNEFTFMTQWAGALGESVEAYPTDTFPDTLLVKHAYLTPAQAIAATLGSEDTYTREDVESAFVSGYSLGLDMFDSSKQEKGWNQNERNLDEEMEDLGWVRKDAATLGAGTCHNVHEPPKDETFWPAPHFKCSECGATHVSMEYVFYCPNCGRKVVDE